MKYIVIVLIAGFLIALLRMQAYVFFGKDQKRKADIIEFDVFVMTLVVILLPILFIRSFFM